jgi:HD-GYP domain-containing protein (c-di-GMP phosphodiesterase class II)
MHDASVAHRVEHRRAVERERDFLIWRRELDERTASEQPGEHLAVHLRGHTAEHVDRRDTRVARQAVVEERMVLLRDLHPGHAATIVAAMAAGRQTTLAVRSRRGVESDMRLAEVIGALSLAADLSSGLSSEKGLRTVLVATRLARLLGLTTEDEGTVFWVSALRFVGCLGFAPEEAVYAAGDDNSMRKTLVFADFDRPLDLIGRVVRGLGPEASLLDRASGIARFFMDRDAPRRHAQSTCESAMFFARTLGMPEAVAESLDANYERFDGKGPRRIPGEEQPASARIADVADVLELFAWSGGADVARTVLLQRRGRALDPIIVDVALANLPTLLRGLRAGSAWEEFLAAEPAPLHASGENVDRGCVALGRFGDMKSVYTLTHSRRVAALAQDAGRAAGLSVDECALLSRAASVHDLGRVAVATGTWDKKGALNPVEWQHVQAHSHHTEVILRGAGLGQLADIAGATHERGRGAGYHRGLSLDGLPLLAKIIAAADVMAALGEERPHRPPLDDDRAAKEMRSLVEAGALDARSTQSVLEARGVAAKRKSAWPGGLSDREVEVARLVAVGRTNKEIGALLGMSPRTAQKHVMNVYDKVGLESRAGLALYALEHGLLDAPER